MAMNPTVSNYVSIQLPLGGHSFSQKDITKCAADGAVAEVVVSTVKSVAVPEPLFNAAAMVDYLAMAHLAVAKNEVAVAAEPKDGIVVVMAVNAECDALLQKSYPQGVVYRSPLTMGELPEEGSVLHLAEGVLYIRVVKQGLQLAEAVEVNGEADILYVLEQIHHLYDIYNMCARVQGANKQLMGACKKVFKNLVCE